MNYFTEYVNLDSIRMKVTDRCHWNCWWCHNEGTGHRNPSAIKDIQVTPELSNKLLLLKKELGISTVHLTGGEPTRHPNLVTVVHSLKKMGFAIKITTIGCPPHILRSLIDVGVDSFNFSVHSLNANQLQVTQINRQPKWIQKQLAQQIMNIKLAKSLGANVKINCVMVSNLDEERVLNVMKWGLKIGVQFRVMNELSSGIKAIEDIQSMLSKIGATEIRRKFIAGSSSYASYFELPSGEIVTFKQIRPYYLYPLCQDCPLLESECTEKFYGLRLEYKTNPTTNHVEYFIRLCLHRSDAETLIPLNEFHTNENFQSLKKTLVI